MDKEEGSGGGGGEPDKSIKMEAKSEASEGRDTSPDRSMDRSSPIEAESPSGTRTPEQSMQSRMEEYLSQMSEQYSAYQTLAAQAAITQQLQAAATASSNTQALATQAALAQYVQQMQLSAAASAASSAATSSKPLSSMLSNMAMLQNAGGYAQAQAMMMALSGAGVSSTAPRRGRGSRGGGSPRGRKLGLKLKRLDSGEYVPRGGGRGSRGGGTGTRGRKREGMYTNANDYMYYMQGAGAELASARSSFNVSPGSTPLHSVDDSETSSLASLDEQFYTEAYPNKLCAFCNLTEKSFLGQGDMVKYTISESALKEFTDKKKKEDEERPESPSDRSKSPSGVSQKRKIRKFTSGDTNEPVDELEVIGYQDEVDVSLVIETNGVYYAHYNCALWSAGVSKSKSEPTKESAVPVLRHVSQAVLNGITTKCAHCKHHGATVQCKASDRVYHWPCAVASGSFMEKASLTMVSVESYDKVAELAPTAAYLYYTGEQWKIGKVAEIPPAKLSNLLYCTTCGQHYLYSGAHIKITKESGEVGSVRNVKLAKTVACLAMKTDIYFVMFVMGPTMLIASVHKWQVFQRMVGNASAAGDARIVTVRPQVRVKVADGMQTTLFVILAISKGIRVLPVPAVEELIVILLKER